MQQQHGWQHSASCGDRNVSTWRYSAASAHKHGAKLVGEIRMADTHQRELDLSDPLVALFVVENQELLIPREDGFTPVALDYSHETVRAHRLARHLARLPARRGPTGPRAA